MQEMSLQTFTQRALLRGFFHINPNPRYNHNSNPGERHNALRQALPSWREDNWNRAHCAPGREARELYVLWQKRKCRLPAPGTLLRTLRSPDSLYITEFVRTSSVIPTSVRLLISEWTAVWNHVNGIVSPLCSRDKRTRRQMRIKSHHLDRPPN